jgi:tRNA pseudouridine38/39 synthase
METPAAPAAADPPRPPLSKRINDLPRNELLAVLLGLCEQLKSSDEAIAAVEKEVSKAEGVRARLNKSSRAAADLKQKVSKQKAFDMSKYSQRHVAIQLQYDGSSYIGFAAQADENEETVEKHLFAALLKLHLIESRGASNYSRCGRTDKGVSALRQVVAFNLRSNLPRGADGVADAVAGADMVEVDYCNILNKVLPPEIRALGVSFVSPDFSARFSATYRTYRYFFIRRNLDTEAMLTAARMLVGLHDFRNFCKLDAPNVTNFEREVVFTDLVCYQESPEDRAHDVMYLEISGLAFLWHMVRCIMALLFMVGKGLEAPGIVSRLMDVAAEPAKPDYGLAADYPLLLYDCGFRNTSFQYNPRVFKFVEAHYEDLWAKYVIAAARVKTSLDFIRGCAVKVSEVDEELQYLHALRQKRPGGGGPAPCAPFLPCAALLLEGAEAAEAAEETEAAEGVSGRACKRLRGGAADRPAAASSSSGGGDGGILQLSVEWGQVKAFLLDDSTNNYTPLLKRARAETFDVRQSRLSGKKKDRLDSHNSYQSVANADELNNDFFAKMREQGSTAPK